MKKPRTRPEGYPEPVAPVTVPDPSPGAPDRLKVTHPAFAAIGASRVSSAGDYLYGSDFEHRNYIRIRISRCTQYRDLSHDWHFPHIQPYIEVALSEAQWATFVSSFGQGDGIPCTLTFRDWPREGDNVPFGHTPEIAEPPADRLEQVNAEVQETLQDVDTGIQAALSKLAALKVPQKALKELTDLLEKARQNLTVNLPYVVRSFDKHAEDTVEKAKVEVNAYLTAAVQRAGLQALGAPIDALPTLPAPETERSAVAHAHGDRWLCGNCYAPLETVTKPCPKCGSTLRS